MAVKRLQSARLAIGDLRQRVTVYTRGIDDYSEETAVDYSLTILKTVWCKFKSTNPYSLINGETSLDEATHLVYIRSKGNEEINNGCYIEFKEHLYRVVEMYEHDESGRFKVLVVRLSGDKTNASSKE